MSRITYLPYSSDLLTSIFPSSFEVHSDLIPPLNHQRRHLFRDCLPTILGPDWPRVEIPAQVAAAFFGAVNVFLFVMPLTKPPIGADSYTSLPY